LVQFDQNTVPAPTVLSAPDAAAHQLDQALGHDQTDTRAFLDAGLFPEAVERLEQLRQLFRGKSLAGVADADANRVRRKRHGIHDDRAAGPVVLDRVEQQIDQNLLQPGSVARTKQGASKRGNCMPMPRSCACGSIIAWHSTTT